MVLNASACWVSFLAFDLSRRSEELGYFRRLVESLCFTVGLNFGLTTATEAFTFLSIAAAAALYGANVDVFLEAVTEAAGRRGQGRSGLGILDAVRDAVNAVKVVESLTAIRELLRQEVASDDGHGAPGTFKEESARSTFLNLAALLAVADSSRAGGFDASEWEMTEAEAVRIARVFSQYDVECGGRGGLDRGGVKRLSAELGQPLTDEEAKLAMSYLDEDGNGLVDFPEFVAWWSGTRRVKLRPAGK